MTLSRHGGRHGGQNGGRQKKLAHMELDMVADMEVEKRNFMRLLAGLMSTRNKRENIKF